MRIPALFHPANECSPTCCMARLLFTIVALLGMPLALAEQAYRVDVVVFEHRETSTAAAPVLTNPIVIPEETVNMRSLTTGIDPRFSEQGQQDPSVQSAAAALQQKGYRVLVQRSWIQPALDETLAKPVLIDGGNTIGDEAEVSGWMRITAAEMPQGGAHISMIVNASSVAVGAAAAMSNDKSEPLAGLSAPATSGPSIAKSLDTAAVDQGEDAVAPERVVLKDTRRLKPDTLTYLDHPRLGVLLRLNRLDAPVAGM